MESVWTSIPYITPKSAHLFKKFKIKDLLLGKIPESEISMLRYNSGVSIGTRAKKICSIANNPKKFSTILATIPLISKGTADHLLTQISMERLLNLTNTPENLDMVADLRRSEKRRLGPAAAGNIWKFLLEFE
jgi:hypothetical protein